MCADADAASKRNNTKEHFNIVKKLNGDFTKSISKDFLILTQLPTLTNYQLQNIISISTQKTSLSKKFLKLPKVLKLVNHLVMIIM